MSNIPNKLYKYKPILDDSQLLDKNQELIRDSSGKIVDNGLDALSKGMVWFSKPAALNDPFDCQLKINIDSQYFEEPSLYLNALGLNAKKGVDFANIIQSCRNQGMNNEQIINQIELLLTKNKMLTLKERLDSLKNTLEQQMSNRGILSLTPANNNLLMWAHYAYFHKGYCLEFDTKDCHKKANALKAPSLTKPVSYGDYYPSLIDLKPFKASPNNLVNNLLCYKSNEWSYENEWRCIQQQGDKLYPFPGKLTGIIFGARCSDAAQVAIIKSIQNLPYKVNLYYSIVRNNRFAVEIVKL
jgi:hypothetical protein